MNPWKLPFQRWSMFQHGLAAALLVGCVVIAANWLNSRAEAALAQGSRDLKSMKQQLAAPPSGPSHLSQRDFTHALPSGSRSHDVVHDISGYAQTSGVLIDSLTVEQRPGTAIDISNFQFSVTANAEYRAIKTWLAPLLARHPTLGVQSLSMRPLASESARLDLRLSLVFFVKD